MKPEAHSPALDDDLLAALEEYGGALQPSEAELSSLQASLREIPDAPMPAPWWSRSFWQWSGLLTASVAAVALFWLPPKPLAPPHQDRPRSAPQPRPIASPPRAQALIAKGAFSIRLFAISRKTRYKRKIEVAEREVLFEADQIQFAYHSNQPLHLLIASLNQKGEVALYASKDDKRSMSLPQGKGSLPVLELDGYLGYERIFALVSPRPFDAAVARRALRRAHRQARGDLRGLMHLQGPWQLAWTRLIHKKKK